MAKGGNHIRAGLGQQGVGNQPRVLRFMCRGCGRPRPLRYFPKDDPDPFPLCRDCRRGTTAAKGG